jgi:hypothetical protein
MNLDYWRVALTILKYYFICNKIFRSELIDSKSMIGYINVFLLKSIYM